jgi:hypothetical protein
MRQGQRGLMRVGMSSLCSDKGLRAFDGRTCELNVEEWVKTGGKRHGGCGEKMSEVPTF